VNPNTGSPSLSPYRGFPIGLISRPEIDRWCRGGRRKSRWPALAHAAPHMLPHLIHDAIPAVQCKPSPELGAIDHAIMAAVAAFDAEVHRADAEVLEAFVAGCHLCVINVPLYLALRNLSRGYLGQGSPWRLGEDVSEIQQILVSQHDDRCLYLGEALQRARSAVGAPFGPFSRHQRPVADAGLTATLGLPVGDATHQDTSKTRSPAIHKCRPHRCHGRSWGDRKLLPKFATPAEAHSSMQIIVRDNNVDQALRVLKKRMQREGISVR